MKIIGIGGLGADYRIFQFLDISQDVQVLKWITPLKNESLSDYSLRLSKQINQQDDLVILAVSFGGLIAKELQSILNVKQTILISSIEFPSELASFYRYTGRMNFLQFLPKWAFVPPFWMAKYFFKPKSEHKELLKSILNDTDRTFAKWAVLRLLKWKNNTKNKNLLRIHGDKDRLLKFPSDSYCKRIVGGHHFMVVDQANEISQIIRAEIR